MGDKGLAASHSDYVSTARTTSSAPLTTSVVSLGLTRRGEGDSFAHKSSPNACCGMRACFTNAVAPAMHLCLLRFAFRRTVPYNVVSNLCLPREFS
jgi:hypothetical protein